MTKLNVSQWIGRLHFPGLASLALSAVMLIVLVGLDRYWIQRGILSEQPPIIDLSHLIRSFVIACAAVLALLGLRKLLKPDGGDEPPAMEPWPRTPLGFWLAAGIPLLVAVFMTLLKTFSPQLFYELVKEDSLVEMLSALLALCAGLCLLRVWYLRRSSRRETPALAGVFVFLFAVGCILLAGEEVSWLQRQIGFETPASFSKNIQNEFNFHNFETNRVETAYYVWAFGMTVFAAFLRESVPALRLLPWLRELLPGRVVVCVGALATGLNYDMWNTIPIQAVFFMSVGIMLCFSFRSSDDPGGRGLPLAVLLLMVIGQVLAIGKGHLYVRSWDSTELKEWFMPLSFLLYALELHARSVAREIQPARDVTATSSLNLS